MKYLIIGGGGTGGPLAVYMTRAGKDVTLIARGEHLKRIREKGLAIESGNKKYSVSLKACTMEEYNDSPDIIFVCVKGYSLDETADFIKRIVNSSTVVIPLLNIFTTGQKLQQELPDNIVTDGCIYISANIKEPGVIIMHGSIFRVVFGVRNKEEYTPVLEQVERDLADSGIEAVLSHNIQRDALKKFSYVSPMAACGLYFDAEADRFQREGRERQMFAQLIREITYIAEAMGFPFDEDMAKANLAILDTLAPTASTSMQRDIKKGGKSEIDGLVYEVVRLGDKYGTDVSGYRAVMDKFRNIYK